MISVIIPAAGQGKRMGLGYNKVYADLNGMPILITTIRNFIDEPDIMEIILVVSRDEMTMMSKLIKGIPELAKCKLVAGGKERQDSVYNGLQNVAEECSIVLVHDAARPMVSKEIIKRVVAGVEEFGAAIAGMPAKDTMAMVNDDMLIEAVPSREKMMIIQTPQGFKKEILWEAHQRAKEDNFLGTDEGSLVRRLGYSIKVVEGSYHNIKVTTKSDLLFIKKIFKNNDNEKAFEISEIVNYIKV